MALIINKNKFICKKIFANSKNSRTFAPAFEKERGVLAQVARAFDWQSKGHRFDSDILHQRGSQEPLFYFYLQSPLLVRGAEEMTALRGRMLEEVVVRVLGIEGL